MNNIKTSSILYICLLLSLVESYLYPSNLTCDYLFNPKAVDSPNPRLSWISEIRSAKNGTFPKNLDQSAYQILVATSKFLVSIGNPDLWDTKKTISNRTFGVRYEGKTVTPGQTVFWSVRVWDQRNVTSFYAVVSRSISLCC